MYMRKCPKCGKEISYTRKWKRDTMEKRGTVCVSCTRRGKPHSSTHRQRISDALIGREFTDEHKKNMRLARVGMRLSEEHKRNIGLASKARGNPTDFGLTFKGRTHSRKSRKKMRLSVIHTLKERYPNGKTDPFYNPIGCQRIDEYGKKHGYHFQHALNGGEFFIEGLGYWVDGYDKEKNVVIEYNERYHDKPCQHKKDEERKRQIIKHLGCEFIELKERTYNELANNGSEDEGR